MLCTFRNALNLRFTWEFLLLTERSFQDTFGQGQQLAEVSQFTQSRPLPNPSTSCDSDAQNWRGQVFEVIQGQGQERWRWNRGWLGWGICCGHLCELTPAGRQHFLLVTRIIPTVIFFPIYIFHVTINLNIFITARSWYQPPAIVNGFLRIIHWTKYADDLTTYWFDAFFDAQLKRRVYCPACWQYTTAINNTHIAAIRVENFKSISALSLAAIKMQQNSTKFHR